MSLRGLVLGTVLAVPLGVYSVIGAYGRYTADDFCWAGVLRTEGFWNSQLHYYTDYSPRYAFTFVVGVAELVGPAIVPVLPAAAIVIWVGLLTWTLAQFDIAPPRALLLAEGVALATLQTAPDLAQSLYWQTGLLTYLLPLMLASFLVGWIRRGVQTWWAIGLSGVLTMVAGGLSETYLIPQDVALTLAVIVALALGKTRRAHLTAALIGGVVALAIIVLSPSITGRVGGTPADFWLAMSAAIATAWYQAVRLLRYFAPLVLLTLALPPLVLGGACPINRRDIAIVTVAVALTLPFCYFPSFYAQNGNPPARSLIVPGALLIGYLTFLGFALRPLVAERVPAIGRTIALAGLMLVPLGVAALTWPQQSDAARYAALFDAEDQHIQATRDAGQLDLTVAPLPSNMGEAFVGPDRSDWFNMCVARYYGVRSIATPS